MPDSNLKQTAQSVIPDDPESSTYRFIIVAAEILDRRHPLDLEFAAVKVLENAVDFARDVLMHDQDTGRGLLVEIPIPHSDLAQILDGHGTARAPGDASHPVRQLMRNGSDEKRKREHQLLS